MLLGDLLKGLDYDLVKGVLSTDIKGITNDSRKVQSKNLFVCIDGYHMDGHDYIKGAITKGATAVLIEKECDIPDDITVVKVQDTRRALSHLAKSFYGDPAKAMGLIGVTGTNGKTSTVILICHILKSYGIKTGMIGTIENRIGDQVLPSNHTTPDILELQELFTKMVTENTQVVVMEVSSHALHQRRVEGLVYDVGIFTNLTLDHLDYHETMEKYRDAKGKLFGMSQIGIVNIDDPAGRFFLEQRKSESMITFGCNNKAAMLNAIDIVSTLSGTQFRIHHGGIFYTFNIQTPGKFSVYNALAAIAATLALKVPIGVIQEALTKESTVRGRFQTLKSPTDYYAVIDYAHTPDGLLNVLRTISEIKKARVITVFGCGGDRDRSKRSEMGKIAGELSDYVVITSDNPRTEDPMDIIADIVPGIETTPCPYEILQDREKAIEKALLMAKKQDIVLIAGKGHEDYQIIGREKMHFDDAEKVQGIFERLAK